MWDIVENACNSGGAESLILAEMQETGKKYALFVSIEFESGQIQIDSFIEQPLISETGEYIISGIASGENLIISPISFTGCITSLELRETPDITIDETIIAYDNIQGDHVTYEINWLDFQEGCYQIQLLDYYSDSLDVALSHPRTKLLTWKNTNNAYGFNYTDFEQSLRLECKLVNSVFEKANKDVFVDSAGRRRILTSRTVESEYLIVAEIPQHLHQSLAIALEHHIFKVDSVDYICEEEEYAPNWRKSSHLAPVEVEVRKKRQNLVNGVC
jgi:hypothetical protein